MPEPTRSPATPGPEPALGIATLRALGAHLIEPVRFHLIETLARRAAQQVGPVRQQLDARLNSLLADYMKRHVQAQPGPRSQAVPAASPPGPLAELLKHIARHSAAGGEGRTGDLAPASPAHPAELKALKEFRSAWSKLSVDQSMHRSKAKLPENAGPFNSHRLALRSLELMRATAPAYFERFISHVDALMWLEQVRGGGAPLPANVVRTLAGTEGATADTAPAEKKRKPRRSKAGGAAQ